MASKSKRRGRVFRASCILAALIIAGSSFAWFTSKDEVTNRLTANADYGVSIVESFAPPKNWIPGQTVNKDVYAVNTGNIDAFVKTDVSGVVNMTYENLSTTFDATKAVKLTLDQVKAIHGGEDGFKTHEAGGWLAWTDATGVDTGSINEGRTGDVAEPWTPTKNGVYVFRRAINKVSENNPFTYSGYYYKDGEYYKINLGDDTFPAKRQVSGSDVNYVFDIYAESTDLFGANATDDNFIDQKTGTIKSPVNFMYVVEDKVTDEDVTLTFDSAHNRLIAEYEIPATTVGGQNGTYDAKAAAARAQVDYENARAAYDAAVASYNNAVANKAYGKALATAEQALYDAKVALEGKYSDAHTNGTEQAWTTAQTNAYKAADYLDTTAGTMPTTFTASGTRSGNATTGLNDLSDGIAALKPTTIMTDEFYQALNGSGDPATNPYVQALNAQDSALRAAYNNYVALYREIYGTDETGNNNGLYKDVTTLLTTIKDNTDESDTGKAADAKAASATLKTKAGTLKDKMDALRAAYTDLKDETTLATGLDTSAATAALLAQITGMQTVATNFKTNAAALDALVDALVTAENNYVTDKNELNEEIEAWKKAVDKYNTDVTTAQTAYNVVNASDGVTSAAESIAAANAWDTNNDSHIFEDKSKVVVPAYSAITTANGEDPVIKSADVLILKTYDGNGTLPNTLSSGVSIYDIDTDDNDSIDDNLVENNFTANHLIGTETDRNNHNDQKTIAEWNALINDSGSGLKDVLAAKKAAYDTAKANSSTGHGVKFYINLNPTYTTDWQIDAQDQDEKTKFDFYYRWVLVAGETTKSKLIDSVEFDSEIEAGAYKNLTFDLNVGLDSVQVTYDDSQNLYKTDAVTASTDFTLKVVNPTEAFNASQQLTWGTPTP